MQICDSPIFIILINSSVRKKELYVTYFTKSITIFGKAARIKNI